MATFFHRSIRSIDTAEATAVTSTSDTTIVLSILTANSAGVANTDITCNHKDSSNAIKNSIAFTVVVPADSSVELLSNKYVLPSGDKLTFQASTSGNLDVAVSYVVV